jgi:syntaxin 18
VPIPFHSIPTSSPTSLTTVTVTQNAAIASLTSYLHTIRQPYLSTAPPPRRNRLSSQDQFKYLTDRQREEIDAQTKQLLRELNASIRNLADAEQIRQNTQTAIARKKYARLGLGALGSWAAGGAGQTKSYEQEQEEAKALAIRTHRESVLWYLRRKLQECGGFQASMMEKRIRREMERNRSVLEKSEFGPMHDYGYDSAAGSGSLGYQTTKMGHAEAPLFVPEEELTPQQIQMFEKQNQDMLKQYESTLNQVS